MTTTTFPAFEKIVHRWGRRTNFGAAANLTVAMLLQPSHERIRNGALITHPAWESPKREQIIMNVSDYKKGLVSSLSHV